MEPMTAFLLAMQAAGLVTSIFSAHNQDKYIQLGKKLEQEQYTTNLQAVKLKSADESLTEMKQLRHNIGSQIVMQAARGNRGGSSYAGINKASNTFESDERKRRMNLLAAESDLRANHVLSGLHTLQSETQLGQNLLKTTLDTIQTTSLLTPTEPKKNKPKAETPAFSWGF